MLKNKDKITKLLIILICNKYFTIQYLGLFIIHHANKNKIENANSRDKWNAMQACAGVEPTVPERYSRMESRPA